MSFVENLAQAASQNTPAYTAAVISPRWMDCVAIGWRSRSANAVHQWVSSHGCSQASCEIESRMNISTSTSTMAMVAPIGCSVRVEMNSPIAPSAENCAARYSELNTSRHTLSAGGI